MDLSKLIGRIITLPRARGLVVTFPPPPPGLQFNPEGVTIIEGIPGKQIVIDGNGVCNIVDKEPEGGEDMRESTAVAARVDGEPLFTLRVTAKWIRRLARLNDGQLDAQLRRNYPDAFRGQVVPLSEGDLGRQVSRRCGDLGDAPGALHLDSAYDWEIIPNIGGTGASLIRRDKIRE